MYNRLNLFELEYILLGPSSECNKDDITLEMLKMAQKVFSVQEKMI